MRKRGRFVRSEVWVALALSGLSILLHALIPRDVSRELFAVVLGSLGGVYLGGALKAGTNRDIAITALGALVCVGFAVAGLRGPLWIIGAGFLAHAVWDWVHHAIRKGTVGRWWPPFCAIYDVVVGGYLLAVSLTSPSRA
ncbi:MAG: hypothetical protein KF691_08895 [Phycisphaeraceae bacterium]|nr:hypothetical protein [Phycisphaeraceae bacterium]